MAIVKDLPESEITAFEDLRRIVNGWVEQGGKERWDEKAEAGNRVRT